MKTTRMILVLALGLCTAGHGQDGGPMLAEVGNEVSTNQNQNVAVDAGDVHLNMSGSGGRTPPLTTFPPHLPYWTHGGWGTIKAYFPNGPTGNDQIYETTFDPRNPDDMRELRSVLQALPHKGVLAAVGGALNGVAAALFGAPDAYFRGRGLEIANSVVRDRRPDGKALLVFIDSNVDAGLLGEEGYAYVGKVSVEGDPDRNWDQAYKTAIAEALLWDVDVLLISGGMKGITSGTNTTFPSAAGGYSQVNYSLSLLGGRATGITEGKGKAVLSAEGFRYSPQTVERRRIPMALYDRIRSRPRPAAVSEVMLPPPEVFRPATDAGKQMIQAPADVADELVLPPPEIFRPSPDVGSDKVLHPTAVRDEVVLPPTEIFAPSAPADREMPPTRAAAVTEISAPATPAPETPTPAVAVTEAPVPVATVVTTPAPCAGPVPGPVAPAPCARPDPVLEAPVPAAAVQEPTEPCPAESKDPAPVAPPCGTDLSPQPVVPASCARPDSSPVAPAPAAAVQEPTEPCLVEAKGPVPVAPTCCTDRSQQLVMPAPCARPDSSPVAPIPAAAVQTPARTGPVELKRPASVAPSPCARPAPKLVAPRPAAAIQASAPTCPAEPKRAAYQGPGITMSRELFELAGFTDEQQVGYVRIIEK